MSDFRVDTKKLDDSQRQLRELSRQIEDLKSRVRSVSGRLTLQSTSTPGIRRSITAAANSCGGDAEDIRRLSAALGEIAALYEKTEKMLLDQGGSAAESIRNETARLRNEIEELGGMLGMDGAALFSNDPVNMSNGNYVYEKTFFGFDTVISVNFRMFYNACSQSSGALGKGWVHNFELRLQNEGEQLRIISEDGSARTFLRNADGSCSPCPGTLGSLMGNASQWNYLDPEQDCYCFDADGRFLAAVNPDGWRMDLVYGERHLEAVNCTDGITLRFGYDECGKLVSVTDHSGRTVRLGYEGELLTQVWDPAGNMTRYTYDENGRMCEITAPNGDLSVRNVFDQSGRTLRQHFADGGVVAYRYEDSEDAVVMVRQNGSEVAYYHDALFRNTRTVYPDGEEQITYNENNQRTSFTDRLGRTSHYGYDSVGRLADFVNAAGHRLSFGYTEAGQLSSLLLDGELIHRAEYDFLGHQVLSVDANGAATGYEYDQMGRVKAVTHEDGSRTELEYDGQGNVVCVRDPVTGCTRYRYDDCRRVVSSTDALGNETQYVYDAVDQLTKVVNANGDCRTYSYDPRGNLTRIVDFNGGVTEVTYNAMNRPVCVTDPDGNATRFEYDQMSNVIRKTAADGGVTEIGYDTEGRMTSIRHPMGGVETAQYDAAGNMIRRCAPDGGVFRFVYDELDRPVSVTDPVGGVRSAVYDKQGHVTSVIYEDGSREFSDYDKLGNRLSHTDRSGYTRYFQYSPLGKLTRISDDDGILAQMTYGPGGKLLRECGADGACVEYDYDAAGNIVAITDSVRGRWNFLYDSLGQMVSSEHVGEGTEYYEYDPLGNICAVTDGEGNRTAYQYSKAGALEKVTDARGNETGYCYDGCYRLLKILRPENGRIDAERFNACNQKQKGMTTACEWDLDGNLTAVLDNAGGRISYQYDACGRMIRKQDQDGNVVSCTYRADGMEDLLTFSDGHSVRYQYDALKRLSQVEDWLGITRISRDAADRVVKVEDHGGNTMEYAWNGRGQCTRMRYPDGHTVHYGYDEVMRLTSLTSGEDQVRYEYYGNGQLRRKHLADRMCVDYGYDAVGRIASLDYSCGGAKTDRFTYAYDACSRKSRISERHGDAPEMEYGFAYDALGCLKQVTRNGQLWQSFDYDVFGNRSRMTRGGETTSYSYDALGRLIRSSGAGMEKAYSYDKRGNLTGETVNGKQRLTLHFDALDRLSKAVSSTGEADYTYNGMAMLAGIRSNINGKVTDEHLMFDYALGQNRLLAQHRDGRWEDYAWDRQPVLSCGSGDFFLNDERMTGFGVLSGGSVSRCVCDPFGVAGDRNGEPAVFGFGGYRRDAVTGYYDGGWRQYDAANGRFISQDPVAGSMLFPVSVNPYIYCMSDPINRLDPTGMIVAWLAGGIVGAVVNVGVKFAGDVVSSVAAGEWQGGSWQSYVGAAAGGFVQGSVLVVAGPTAAGAAGAATETLVSNGLSMATGAKGFRKEDGYGISNLLWDTGKSAAGGAISGFTFGAAAKYLKIPGITSGRGSAAAVWKQVMTKAMRGQIANVTMKTMMKGLLSFGLVKTLDTIICKGIDAIKEHAKEKGLEILRNLFTGNSAEAGTSLMGLFSTSRATCATT